MIKTSSSKLIFVLILILLFAFSLRIFGFMSKYPGTDEKHTLRLGAGSLTNQLYSNTIKDSYPPFYYFMSGILLKIYPSVYLLRFAMVLFGLLSIFLFYKLLSLLFDPRLALLSSFLLAIHPMHVIYSQHPRPYIFLTFLLLLSIYLLVLWIQTQKRIYFFSLLLVYLISFYTHYYTAFFIILQAAFIFFYDVFFSKKTGLSFSSKKSYLLGLGVVAFLCLLWLPIFLQQYQYIITQKAIALDRLTLTELPYPFYKLALMVNLTPTLHSFPYLLVSAFVISLLFLYGSYKLLRKGFAGMLLLAHFYGISLIAMIIGFFVPVYSFRYLSYLLPLYVFFVAYGLLHIRHVWLRRFLLTLLVLTWLFVDLYYFSLMTFRIWAVNIGV